MTSLSLSLTLLALGLVVVVTMPMRDNGGKVSYKDLKMMVRENGLLKSHKITSFLTNYIRTKFPNLSEKQEKRMRRRLVKKIRRKILTTQLRRPWYGQEEGYARMLG